MSEKKTIRVDFTENEYSTLQKILTDLKCSNNMELLSNARLNAKNAVALLNIIRTNKENNEGVYTRHVRVIDEKLGQIGSTLKSITESIDEKKKAMESAKAKNPRQKVRDILKALEDIGFEVSFSELPIHKDGIHVYDTQIHCQAFRQMGYTEYSDPKRPEAPKLAAIDLGNGTYAFDMEDVKAYGIDRFIEDFGIMGACRKSTNVAIDSSIQAFHRLIRGTKEEVCSEGNVKAAKERLDSMVKQVQDQLSENDHNILRRADKIVNERAEEKERQYGPFSKSMERTATLFNMVRGREGDNKLTAQDAYWLVACMKLAREGLHHKEDNLLDLVAYFGSLNNYEEGIKDK